MRMTSLKIVLGENRLCEFFFSNKLFLLQPLDNIPIKFCYMIYVKYPNILFLMDKNIINHIYVFKSHHLFLNFIYLYLYTLFSYICIFTNILNPTIYI